MDVKTFFDKQFHIQDLSSTILDILLKIKYLAREIG